MKNKHALQKGFTLVELLIVIALLGALAVGLLAAIDPFEQLKKGRDTSIRNATSELHNAVIRYFAIKSELPWYTGLGTSVPSFTADANQDSANLAAIIGLGELKTNYTTVINSADLQRIRITSTAYDDVAVCFMPESKSFLGDPNSIYDATAGEVASGCKSQTTDGSSCFWCVR